MQGCFVSSVVIIGLSRRDTQGQAYMITRLLVKSISGEDAATNSRTHSTVVENIDFIDLSYNTKNN